MRAEHPDKAYRTFTDAEEIAEALVFLCSDAAREDERRSACRARTAASVTAA